MTRTLPARPCLAAVLLGALLTLAGSACKRAPVETRFLNADPESSSGAFLSGFSGFEKTDAGDTFVWAQSREARVAVVAAGSRDRLVRLRAWPYRWDGAPPQRLTLYVNETRIDSVPMADGPRVYSFLTPAAAWHDGTNEIRFELAYAEAPRDRVPGATDARTLAMALDWLEIVTSPGPSPSGRGGPGRSP